MSTSRTDVCVIEDDPVERQLLVRRLTNLGYSVADAADGEEGWTLIHRRRPRIVICDLMLPGINGVQICERIRADGSMEGMYVVVISALSAQPMPRALNAGADDFLNKPYDPEELTAQVRNGMRLQRLQERLRRDALTDGLTDLANYNHFCDVLDREFSRVRRYGGMLSLLMIDLDHFKIVNDTYGHEVGNDVLREVAKHLLATVRETDFVARYGGEEFVVISPETSLDEAAGLAERIRQTLPRQVRVSRAAALSVRASIGVASASDARAATATDFVNLADQALYRSKREGRDRVTRCDRLGDPSASVEPKREDVERLRREIVKLDMRAKDIVLQTMWSLVQALEARDAYSAWHSRNVTLYTRWLVEATDWPEPRRHVTINAAMLHDLGRIGVPDRILLKPSPLLADEAAFIRQVPRITCRILEPLRVFSAEIEVIRYLREHYDGSGYPEGLVGEAIPLGSRLVAVAEAFDAMTCDRCYRPSRSIETVLAEMRTEAGRQFDPQCVKLLQTTIARNPQRWRDQIGRGRAEAPQGAELLPD